MKKVGSFKNGREYLDSTCDADRVFATCARQRGKGDMVSKALGSGATPYTWDFENRLSSAVLPGSGGAVTFKYDPFGRRIQKAFTQGTTTTTTNYVYDGANDIEEIDQNGNLLARYTQGAGIDEPLAELRSGTASYYEQDGLGSVTSLSTSTGSLGNTYVYTPFGNLASSTGNPVNPFQYTGRGYDPETGLRYYRARYYDRNVGRFISEDPVQFAAGSNFYRYANNSPVNWRDPLGLCPPDRDPCDVPNHPWYASVDINIFELWGAGPLGPLWLFENVLPNGPWDYKTQGPYDDFGNFNFGATGASQGIPDEVLLRGAGALKAYLLYKQGKSDPDGSPFGPYPYGNDRQKQDEIQFGIEYYKHHCWLTIRIPL